MEAQAAAPAATTDKRKELEKARKRVKSLKESREKWMPTWRQIAKHFRPRHFREIEDEKTPGGNKEINIINNTGVLALRKLAALMMMGVTSPARPWFKLSLRSRAPYQVTDDAEVKDWLEQVESAIRETLAKSNIYTTLHQLYFDLACFGTGCMFVEEDAKDDVRGYQYTVGSFMLSTNSRRDVDTVAREFTMTVAQVVDEFTLEKCSTTVQDHYKAERYEKTVEVVHLIEPNRDYSVSKAGPAGMQWRSCWFERKGECRDFLSEKGYYEFPCMAPRWDAVGEDVYGYGPCLDALGDTKSLQHTERTKAKAADKIVDPPMVGPSSLQGNRASLLPGAITFVDAVGQGQTFRPAIEVKPEAITVAQASISEEERRIKAATYADLVMLITETQDRERTAREVAELSQEKMMQLGPVIERLTPDLLTPLISRCFYILLRRKKLPPPPRQVQGHELGVDLISILAQAQKALGTAANERLLGILGQLSQLKPESLDKVDFDALIDDESEKLGVSAKIIVTEDRAGQIRQARAQAQQRAAALQQAQAQAQTAKTLSQADTTGGNALSDYINQLAPGTEVGST